MIEKQIEELIKNRITKLKLIDTGALLASINVTLVNGKINIEAKEYFKYLDERYDILNYVTSSSEFNDIISKIIEENILKELDN